MRNASDPWLLNIYDLNTLLYLVAINKASLSFDIDGLDYEKTVVCFYDSFEQQQPFYVTLPNEYDVKSNIYATLLSLCEASSFPVGNMFNYDNLDGRYFLNLYAKLEDDIFIYNDTNSSDSKDYKIAINLGSLYGSMADAEDLPFDKLNVIEYLSSNYGYHGVVAWVASKRNSIPEKIKDSKEFINALRITEDLNKGAVLIREIKERRWNVVIRDTYLKQYREDMKLLNLLDDAAQGVNDV